MEETKREFFLNRFLEMEQIAREIGVAAAVFGGDPRGCTVKLTFADGATNDFGGEGWCVPRA